MQGTIDDLSARISAATSRASSPDLANLQWKLGEKHENDISAKAIVAWMVGGIIALTLIAAQVPENRIHVYPDFDAHTVCNEWTGISAQDYNSCLVNEKAAYDDVSSRWREIPIQYRKWCQNKIGHHQHLLACIQDVEEYGLVRL